MHNNPLYGESLPCKSNNVLAPQCYYTSATTGKDGGHVLGFRILNRVQHLLFLVDFPSMYQNIQSIQPRLIHQTLLNYRQVNASHTFSGFSNEGQGVTLKEGFTERAICVGLGLVGHPTSKQEWSHSPDDAQTVRTLLYLKGDQISDQWTTAAIIKKTGPMGSINQERKSLVAFIKKEKLVLLQTRVTIESQRARASCRAARPAIGRSRSVK